MKAVPPSWRRNTIPGCPNCGRELDVACHTGCKGVARNNDAKLYIDIATGDVHCIGCGRVWGFTGWQSHCTRCGGVYKGGEIWQGMATETVSMGDVSWFKTAGIQKGTMEITFLGWSSCGACRKIWHSDIGFLKTGTAWGGMCGPCHDIGRKRMHSMFTIKGRVTRCNWCGLCGSSQRKVVHVAGETYICRECCDLVGQQRAALLA